MLTFLSSLYPFDFNKMEGWKKCFEIGKSAKNTSVVTKIRIGKTANPSLSIKLTLE